MLTVEVSNSSQVVKGVSGAVCICRFGYRLLAYISQEQKNTLQILRFVSVTSHFTNRVRKRAKPRRFVLGDFQHTGNKNCLSFISDLKMCLNIVIIVVFIF